ncbi:hypothetical protein JCM5350_001061 [Sporobolomyces pararoseus]
MDYEPAFTPHPSYQLEDSASDSDWAEDDLPLESRREVKIKELPQEPRVHLEGDSAKLEKGGQVVFLVGEAGERLAQGVKVGETSELISVLVEGEQFGAILPPSTEGRATVVFLSTSIQLSYLHPLASFLLETLSPSSSTILASYHLPSYIPPSTTESQTAFSSRLPILALSSSSVSDSALASLRSDSTIESYLPPNLLHGLPSSLLIVSSLLSPSPPTRTTLLLLPTTTPPQPLNGPFSHLSPVTQPSITTLYDAGGPVGLSDPSSLFRQLSLTKLQKIKQTLGWDWWNPATVLNDESRGGRRVVGVPGKGFEWLEKSRKSKKKEQTSSMFM